MTPDRIISSRLLRLRMFSTNRLSPGMLDVMRSIVPWTPLKDMPCDRRSEWISAAWWMTAADASIEFIMWLRSRIKCCMASSCSFAFPCAEVFAPAKSSSCSFFRVKRALVFWKSPVKSNRISRYRLTKSWCWDFPDRSAAGANLVWMRSDNAERVRCMSLRSLASSSVGITEPVSAEFRRESRDLSWLFNFCANYKGSINRTTG